MRLGVGARAQGRDFKIPVFAGVGDFFLGPALQEDFFDLLEAFLRQEGIKTPRVTEGARELLRRYAWPGNVRELKNMAQAVTLLTETGTIDESVIASYLGSRFQLKPGALSIHATAEETPDSIRKLADLEREEILRALRVFRGYVPEAARALGMGRATLYKYIKKHDIHLEIYGGGPAGA